MSQSSPIAGESNRVAQSSYGVSATVSNGNAMIVPPPTESSAWILIVTYAGFLGESDLLDKSVD